MDTYLNLFQNEVREVELVIRNDDETKFVPTSASCLIYDEDGKLVETCDFYLGDGDLNQDNIIIATITTLTTENFGNYFLIWNIYKNNLIFKHRTNIIVGDITN